MIKINSENILEQVETVIDNEYFKCYCSKQQSFIICEALLPYIPVEHFISTFEAMTDIIEQHKIEKFIFDKRSLKAFHQPTMEWYFVEWKQKLLKRGLKKHRKILPNESWFRKCVEAGKASILKDNPTLNIDDYDIQYYDSIHDCIEN